MIKRIYDNLNDYIKPNKDLFNSRFFPEGIGKFLGAVVLGI